MIDFFNPIKFSLFSPIFSTICFFFFLLIFRLNFFIIFIYSVIICVYSFHFNQTAHVSFEMLIFYQQRNPLINYWNRLIVQGQPTNFFFLENALKKKLLNIFSNFFFIRIQSFRLIMENNCIQMVKSTGNAVAYTINPIFKHVIDCVQPDCLSKSTNWKIIRTRKNRGRLNVWSVILQ